MSWAMTHNVKVPDPVHEQAKQLKEEHDFATLGEAIRHMCKNGEWDV